MLNRIRISTTLFLILILCGVLQVGSNGLSFWAFRDGYQNLQEVEASNQQRSALAQTRAVLLQASTALNKAGTLTALSYPPDDIKALMATARNSLKQADAQFKTFTVNIKPPPSFPGMMSLAIAPAIRPKMIHAIIPIAMPSCRFNACAENPPRR